MQKSPLFFTGSSHPELAKQICKAHNLVLGKMNLGQFPDGETSVEILENVEGRDVYVMQSIAWDPNEYFMEILIIIDALKRSGAKNITAVLPYFCYSRQDRKDKKGAPITAKLVAKFIESAGATKIITLDLHADQIEGFFEIPVYQLGAQERLCFEARKKIEGEFLVVAPDIGSIKIAERATKFLDCDLAVIKKIRSSPYDLKMSLIGNVKDKTVLLVDDLCSTAGTLVFAAELCQKQGAKKVFAIVTHGLFTGEALSRIQSSNLEYLWTTDSVPLRTPSSSKIHIVPIAPLFSENLVFLK